MGIVFRQSIKASALMLSGAVLGGVINWLFSFMVIKQLFGFHRIVSNSAGFIQYFALLGIGPAVATLLPRFAPGSLKRSALLRVAALLPLITVSLFTLAYYLLKPQVLGVLQPQDRVLWDAYYHLLPPLVLVWAYLTLLDIYLVAHHRSAMASFARELVMRVATLVALLLYYFGHIGFGGLMWSLLATIVLPAVVMLPVAVRIPGFGFRGAWSAFTGKEWKEIRQFSWYHLLYGTSALIMNTMDGLLLSILAPTGLAAVPVYSMALFLATLMIAPYRAMVNAAFPSLNEAYASGDTARIATLYERAGINILIAGMAMVVILAPNVGNAARFFAKGYESLAPLALIMMLGRLVDMATGMNESLISVSSYYRFNFRASALLMLAMVTLCFLLIPRYGPPGAAWAGTISVALFNLIRSWYLWRKMGIRPLPHGAARVVFAGLIAAAAAWAIPHIPSTATHPRDAAHYLRVLADAVIRAAAGAGIYGALILWLRPSPDLAGIMDRLRKRRG